MPERRISSRRAFLTQLSAAAGVLPLLPACATPVAAARPPNVLRASGALTIQDVIDIIMDAVPGEPLERTSDTFKSGDPSLPVTGIASTFLATCDIIEQSIALGANLIVTHEPTYFDAREDQSNTFEGDPVYEHKRELLESNKVAVWRFHDHWHLYRPDGVLTGFVQDMGWEDNESDEDPRIRVLEPTTLGDLARSLKQGLGIQRPVQLVGDAGMAVRRVGVLPGAWGGTTQMNLLREHRDIDALIVGEIAEWETSIYGEDALCSGRNIGLIVLGHAVSEQPGMRWFADWLRPRVPDVPVHFVRSRDPFSLI